MKIAVVIPTIRPDSYKTFLEAWRPLFNKHDVHLFTVWDGENPVVNYKDTNYSIPEVMEGYEDVIYNFNSGVRNAGFALAYKLIKPDMYLTLDDDEIPDGDTIQDHIDILNKRVPVSWITTASEYMRGFPYGIREEAEVVLSHGVWKGVADWDAPTQLVMGNRPVTFYKGPIPKGIYFPMCIMNLAFKPKVLPYIFQPPQGEKVGIWRFDDMWSGVLVKRYIDENGWAAVSGYSSVIHERMSNVWTNLKHEGTGLKLNETFWQGDESDPFFAIYREKLERWQEFLKKYE
ncbi:MAG: hypothetical protein NUV86_09510 [Candidatus Scalindua sp.]|nr:hypothetical protein [Candidatus Scalindua sp.]